MAEKFDAATEKSTDLGQTPSQTIGPYFAFGLTPGQYDYAFAPIADGARAGAAAPGTNLEGEAITIIGRVLDGEGAPIDDAMIELWQADRRGRYAHPADRRGANIAFNGFARFGTGTDPEKRFIFETIKPGALGDGQAPHISLILFMRGILSHAYTRIYFSDEDTANRRDPVLTLVPEERRSTLIAQRRESEGGIVYDFDIHMQGPIETVFFDF